MPHQIPAAIDQGAAAVTRIDGGVGLDVDHRVIGRGLPAERADNAAGDGVIETCGEPMAMTVCPGRHGNPRETPAARGLFLDLDHGQINVAVRADEPGLINALPVPEVGVIGHQLRAWQGQGSRMRVAPETAW